MIAGSDIKDPATSGAPAVPDYPAALDPEALDGATVAVVDNSGESVNTKAVYDTALTTVDRSRRDAPRSSPNRAPRCRTSRSKSSAATSTATSAGSPAATPAASTRSSSTTKTTRSRALKYQQGELIDAAAVDLSDPAQKAAYEPELAESQEGSARSDSTRSSMPAPPATPATTVDLIMVPYDSDLVDLADKAGYPVLTVAGGFGERIDGPQPGRRRLHRRPVRRGGAARRRLRVRNRVSAERLAPSWTNPSMWRCVAAERVLLAAPLPRRAPSTPLAAEPAPVPPVAEPVPPGRRRPRSRSRSCSRR